jgi:hypothetical protein
MTKNQDLEIQIKTADGSAVYDANFYAKLIFTIGSFEYDVEVVDEKYTYEPIVKIINKFTLV